jgi:HD-like signal output (HDOD) protein
MNSSPPPITTPDALVAQATHMVSMPAVYFRVRELVDNPDSSLADLAQVLATDPALSARLLRLANSAFFGLGARIDKVSRAVSLLGMMQVHDLVLATSVTHTFSRLPSQVMDMPRFWRHSVHCGVLARQLGFACNVLDSERLFVAGLLHDLGHLLMYQQMPELARAAALQASREGLPLFRVERGLLGFDYAQVGAALMRAWNMPQGLRDSTEFHPEPARAAHHPRETALVHIAAHEAGGSGGNIDPVVWHITGLNPDVLPDLRTESEAQLAQVLGLIMPD